MLVFHDKVQGLRTVGGGGGGGGGYSSLVHPLRLIVIVFYCYMNNHLSYVIIMKAYHTNRFF